MECKKECPEGSIEFANVCFNDDETITEMIAFIKTTWYYILFICLVAFVFSYVILMLFRYAAKYVVWIINMGSVIIVFTFAILCAVDGIIEGAIAFSLMGLLFIVILMCFRKRIALVAKLFKEASKALNDVPAIMFEPILVKKNYLVWFE